MSKNFIIINEENKEQYKKMVLTYLRNDFNKKNKPQSHFWHNKTTIAEAFDNSEAMVVLDEQGQGKFVAYMIWSLSQDGGRAEIHIIEVNEKYRKQGIFKSILNHFVEKFTETRVLSASVLPGAEVVFDKAGWQSIHVDHHPKKYYKIISPGLTASDTLSNGTVLAVCSIDFYQVKSNPAEYQHLMKYFQISLDKDRQLETPIITEFFYEGYIGVYFNKELICEGKAKHLFQDRTANGELNLLILNRIIPMDPKPFNEKGFFSQLQTSNQKRTYVNTTQITALSTSMSNSDEQLTKKPRVRSNITFFSSAEPKENNKEETASTLNQNY